MEIRNDQRAFNESLRLWFLVQLVYDCWTILSATHYTILSRSKKDRQTVRSHFFAIVGKTRSWQQGVSHSKRNIHNATPPHNIVGRTLYCWSTPRLCPTKPDQQEKVKKEKSCSVTSKCLNAGLPSGALVKLPFSKVHLGLPPAFPAAWATWDTMTCGLVDPQGPLSLGERFNLDKAGLVA